jgi:hypothetical protein
MQVVGRYSDTIAFDYMGKMGVWFENFSLPAVINECLLQSYNNILRFFPNWPKESNAEFKTLHAVGGFLVSASFEAGEVQWIEVFSESGSKLHIYNPWNGAVEVVSGKEVRVLEGELLQ